MEPLPGLEAKEEALLKWGASGFQHYCQVYGFNEGVNAASTVFKKMVQLSLKVSKSGFILYVLQRRS